MFQENSRGELIGSGAAWLWLMLSLSCAASSALAQLPETRMAPNTNAGQIAGSLPLLKNAPSFNLAKGAKVGVVTGIDTGGGVGTMSLYEPTTPIVLVLSTRDPVRWEIHNAPSNLRAILVSSATGQSQVQAKFPVPVYAVSLPYATSVRGPSFRRLVRATGALIDFEYLSSSHAQRDVRGWGWSEGTPTAALRKTDVPLGKPPERGEFYLVTPSGAPIGWTLAGPAKPQDRYKLIDPNARATTDGQLVFKVGSALQILDRRTGQTTLVEVPEFAKRLMAAPEVNRTVGYDAARSTLLLSLSKYLFTYDLQKQLWSAMIDMNIGAQSASFDRQADSYVFATSSLKLAKLPAAEIYALPRRTEPREYPPSNVEMRPHPAGGLPDLLETFDEDYRGDFLPLTFSAGSTTAVVVFLENKVRRIWSYDPKTDKALLTYDSER